jgi:hypothetical protein
MGEAQSALHTVGSVLIILAAAIGTASVVVHARVPWWRSQMGRHLMAYMLVIALVLDLSVVRLIVGDSWWFALLRLLVFTGIPLVLAWRLWLQIKAQRRPDHLRKV